MHWLALQPEPAQAGPGAAVWVQPDPDASSLTGPRSDAPRLAQASAQAPLADSCTALGWWALQFTPLVARLEDAVVLEASGSERLFGGRAALLQQLLATPPELGAVAYAQGPTALLALARLRCAAPDAPADAMPLRALAAAAPHAATLARLGCTHWGQLRALPRGGVARRFGADLLHALDCAYGDAPLVLAWMRLPEVFDAPLELAAPVESAPALLFAARRLLAQLQVWLRARQQGVLALELLWELDARRGGQRAGPLQLRTAEATQDMQHLQRLLAEQLARTSLSAPVLHLRLRTLETQAHQTETLGLLLHTQRSGDSLHQTVERIQARLGSGAVRSVQLQADHLPECMQRWQPWAPAPTPARTSTRAPTLHPNAAHYPCWLLEQPVLLAVQDAQPHYHGALTLLAGPQRLETHWLDAAAALRDYFVARSPHAGLLWVYRERRSGSTENTVAGWYLHGVFA